MVERRRNRRIDRNINRFQDSYIDRNQDNILVNSQCEVEIIMDNGDLKEPYREVGEKRGLAERKIWGFSFVIQRKGKAILKRLVG